MSASVLYDVPGPRARARNRLIGVVGTLVVVGLVGFVIYRLVATGQFSPRLWEWLQYKAIQLLLLDALLATLQRVRRRRVCCRWCSARCSRPGGSPTTAGSAVRSTAVVEFFRAVPLLILIFILYFGLPQGLGIVDLGVLGAGHRPDALQRLGARRGLPGRGGVAAARPDRGRLRAGHAQDPGDDARCCSPRRSGRCCRRSSASSSSCSRTPRSASSSCTPSCSTRPATSAARVSWGRRSCRSRWSSRSISCAVRASSTTSARRSWPEPASRSATSRSRDARPGEGRRRLAHAGEPVDRGDASSAGVRVRIAQARFSTTTGSMPSVGGQVEAEHLGVEATARRPARGGCSPPGGSRAARPRRAGRPPAPRGRAARRRSSRDWFGGTISSSLPCSTISGRRERGRRGGSASAPRRRRAPRGYGPDQAGRGSGSRTCGCRAASASRSATPKWSAPAANGVSARASAASVVNPPAEPPRMREPVPGRPGPCAARWRAAARQSATSTTPQLPVQLARGRRGRSRSSRRSRRRRRANPRLVQYCTPTRQHRRRRRRRAAVDHDEQRRELARRAACVGVAGG